MRDQEGVLARKRDKRGKRGNHPTTTAPHTEVLHQVVHTAALAALPPHLRAEAHRAHRRLVKQCDAARSPGLWDPRSDHGVRREIAKQKRSQRKLIGRKPVPRVLTLD